MPGYTSRQILFAIAPVLVLWGCRSVQLAPGALRSTSSSSASHVSRASTDTPVTTLSRWPTRWGNNPDQPGTIIDLDPSEALRPIHLSRFHQFRSTEVEYNDANQLAADIGITTGFKFKAEGPGSFLFIPNPTNEPNPDITQDSGTQTKDDAPDLAFKFVSATKVAEPDRIKVNLKRVSDDPQEMPEISYTMTELSQGGPAIAKSDPNEDHVEIQRTWFTYQDPKENKTIDDPIGTIILLPGIFGTPDPIIDALQRYWHKQGYAILRMRSHPSRFTEHEMVDVIKGEESSIAIHAAKINDNRVAEAAYATKAALEYLHALRPTLGDKPTILVGMSGGAMLLPTVYAYAPDRYAGAVLIAGGADFLTIAIESNYKSWIDSVVFDFKPTDPKSTGSPTQDQLESLSKHYLAASKLDAYHTATEMTDIPVLMLHATNDKAVPSSTGRLLYQQLGEPERWSYPLGHELIFIGLPTQVSRIDRWITEHVVDGE